MADAGQVGSNQELLEKLERAKDATTRLHEGTLKPPRFPIAYPCKWIALGSSSFNLKRDLHKELSTFVSDMESNRWNSLAITWSCRSGRRRAGIPNRGGITGVKVDSRFVEYFALNEMQKKNRISLLKYISSIVLPGGMRASMIVECAFTADINNVQSYKHGFDGNKTSHNNLIRGVVIWGKDLLEQPVGQPSSGTPFPFRIVSLEDLKQEGEAFLGEEENQEEEEDAAEDDDDLEDSASDSEAGESHSMKNDSSLSGEYVYRSTMIQGTSGRARPHKRFVPHPYSPTHHPHQEDTVQLDITLTVALSLPASPGQEMGTLDWDWSPPLVRPLVSEEEAQKLLYNEKCADFLETPVVESYSALSVRSL